MEYKLAIGEEIVAADLDTENEHTFRVCIEDRKYNVSCERIDRQHIALTVNDTRHNIYVDGNSEEKSVTIDGISCTVRDEDAQAQTSRKKKKGNDIPTDITPPMPAVVVRLLVSAGESVTKGQEVVVVSAMKMETALKTAFNGTVTAINVTEGDKVMPGDILVDITKEETANE